MKFQNTDESAICRYNRLPVPLHPFEFLSIGQYSLPFLFAVFILGLLVVDKSAEAATPSFLRTLSSPDTNSCGSRPIHKDKEKSVPSTLLLATVSARYGEEFRDPDVAAATAASAAAMTSDANEILATNTYSLLESRLEDLDRQMHNHLRQNNFAAGLERLKEMTHCIVPLMKNVRTYVDTNGYRSSRLNNFDTIKRYRRQISERLDESFQAFVTYSCTQPIQDGVSISNTRLPLTSWERGLLSAEATQIQLSLKQGIVDSPFHLVPKRTLLLTLKALTTFHSQPKSYIRGSGNDVDGIGTSLEHAADLAFRILQRLVTGVGVRTRKKRYITEHDFNAVMNAYAEIGRMDMVLRVVALQRRTDFAPPLSPVSYSILFKGYGRQGDLVHVRQVLNNAVRDILQPDITMVNSLLDAFVKCHAIDEAQSLFQSLIGRKIPSNLANESTFRYLPRPNSRSYNIYLMGLANAGLYREALNVAHEDMKVAGLWDPVTTNTLVHAAVMSEKFEMAETILCDHTNNDTATHAHISSNRRSANLPPRCHANIEAYTELLDAYSKRKDLLPKAIALLQTMKCRSVEPNEITLTCLIAGFARNHQLDKSRKMIQYMVSAGIPASCVTYNAMISGLLGLSSNRSWVGDPSNTYNAMSTHVRNIDVEEALKILKDMIQGGVRPNAVTVSMLVYALGNCVTPRLVDAKRLIETLERENRFLVGNVVVATALIQACGRASDAAGVTDAFESITQRVDRVAVNTYMDACSRCSLDRVAVDAFEYYYRGKGPAFKSLVPNVIAYSIVISTLLRKGNRASIRHSQTLYKEMKAKHHLHPDATMIDMILKAFVRIRQERSYSQTESAFLVGVIRDADGLSWGKGQLERRKRVVRAVAGRGFQGVWFSSGADSDSDDDLFKRKGWNKVDSSFRFWGSSSDDSASERVVDRFLESKGWNEVNSSFRFI